MASPNAYTREWFSTFLGRIDQERVAPEIAFLERQLPRGAAILDLCCGPGRHLAPLLASGRRVVGLDRDAHSLGEAARRAPGSLLRADLRALPITGESVDAVICMWQSFGHFDASGNRAVLAEIARVLRDHGLLVLDLYNRDFYAATTGSRTIERDGQRIHEQRTIVDGRLRVRLLYEASGTKEEFDWLLYTPAELSAAAASVGLSLRLVCSQFDERSPASADQPRMQLVLSRSAPNASDQLSPNRQ